MGFTDAGCRALGSHVAWGTHRTVSWCWLSFCRLYLKQAPLNFCVTGRADYTRKTVALHGLNVDCLRVFLEGLLWPVALAEITAHVGQTRRSWVRSRRPALNGQAYSSCEQARRAAAPVLTPLYCQAAVRLHSRCCMTLANAHPALPERAWATSLMQPATTGSPNWSQLAHYRATQSYELNCRSA